MLFIAVKVEYLEFCTIALSLETSFLLISLDLVTFPEEILYGKLHFLYSV